MKSITLALIGSVLLFSTPALAGNYNYTCAATSGGTCCDSSVTTCASSTIAYIAGSPTGKLALQPEKIIALNIICSDGNSVGTWNIGTSSTNVTCSVTNKGTNNVQLSCTNWAMDNQYVWLNSSTCN